MENVVYNVRGKGKKMRERNQCQILWRKNQRCMGEILRVYASGGIIEIPGTLEGVQVDAIAPYCFSSARHIPEGNHSLTWGEKEFAGESQDGLFGELKEFSGNLVEEVVLPDTLTEIGASAFYNCKKLRRLTFGPSLRGVGSDAFMNAQDFHEIILTCGPGDKTGLKQILAQISSDMEVKFQGKEGRKAVLVYPEYYESYDEIAPAHLFGRSITGEGFRARQGFREGCVDFAAYDGVFSQACVEESEQTLMKMALNRLMYPFALGEVSALLYREYLMGHITNLTRDKIEKRELKTLVFLCEQGLLSGRELKQAARYASELGWAEGTAKLMEFHSGEKDAWDEYEFEEF